MAITRREGDLPEVKARPWRVECDHPQCVYLVSAASSVEATQRLETHPCPHLGGPTTLGYSVTLSILEKCWIKLDAVLVELKEGNYDGQPDEKVRLRGVCRGMAEVIAEFMHPHFTDADAVAAEAGRRYEAKLKGEPYETLGLGHLKYAGPRMDERNPGRFPVSADRMPPKPDKPAHNFTEEEVGSIKFAHESGMFTVEQLAKTYKVKSEVIELVIKS